VPHSGEGYFINYSAFLLKTIPQKGITINAFN